jgi:hypothetical protein
MLYLLTTLSQHARQPLLPKGRVESTLTLTLFKFNMANVHIESDTARGFIQSTK